MRHTDYAVSTRLVGQPRVAAQAAIARQLDALAQTRRYRHQDAIRALRAVHYHIGQAIAVLEPILRQADEDDRRDEQARPR